MVKDRVSLHDIAPRLAVARDVQRGNIWCAGDDGQMRDGDVWAEVLDHEHSTDRCTCAGTIDCYRIVRRVLVSQNRGHVSRETHRTCRRCGTGRSSYR